MLAVLLLSIERCELASVAEYFGVAPPARQEGALHLGWGRPYVGCSSVNWMETQHDSVCGGFSP
jgi:hypothetical protein